MNRINETNQKNRELNTIQGYRAYDASIFYKEAQKKSDQEWLRLANEQLRKACNTSKLV